MMNETMEEAREFMKAERDGCLCTLSQKLDGWPFGSIAPYALTAAGEPLILISDIAEHTRNLRADARASFLIQASNTRDQQASARATLMGYAIPVSPPFLEDAQRRYLEVVPNAASYFATHDFSFFKIQVSQVRFIGGFGNIHWLDGAELIDRAAYESLDALAPHLSGICQHMNEDHQEALIAYAKAFANIEAESARMIHVDRLGFDMIAIKTNRHKALRLNFPEPVATPDEVRKAMVEMVRRARQAPTG
jgi:putative heme iron utilization protein